MEVTQCDHDFWRGRRVFVTGHTGFKGSWLTLLLLEMGAEVYGFSLEPEHLLPPFQLLFNALNLRSRLGSRHYVGDIRDKLALNEALLQAKPEVVFHLAAQPLVRSSYQDPLGTWSTNVQGSLQVLECLRSIKHPCSIVMVTTDKVYSNKGWEWGYREDDQLGGHDPYSASKAAMELMISSWRDSFCGDKPFQHSNLFIATSRSGNVIGGGDWATDRIVPDVIRSILRGVPASIRNPRATRPWQHVIEPLAGYLRLAMHLTINPDNYCQAYNFGPNSSSNCTVQNLVEALLVHFPDSSSWTNHFDSSMPHEACLLHLVADRARLHLGWEPRWDFDVTTERTAKWYYNVSMGQTALDCCLDDLDFYGF